MLNKKLIEQMQKDASEIGVAVALPKFIKWIDPTSQNQIVFNASQELVRQRAFKRQ